MEDDFIILLLDNGDGRDTANSLFFFVCVCVRARGCMHLCACVLRV